MVPLPPLRFQAVLRERPWAVSALLISPGGAAGRLLLKLLASFRYSFLVSNLSSDPTPEYPLVGAHVGSSGGLSKAIGRACEIGANCVQIFASAPQQWRSPSHPDKEVLAFCAGSLEKRVSPIFLHAIYLLNPSGPDEELRAKSVSSMREYLRWGERLGASGVVVHLGSSSGVTPEQAAENLCASLLAALEEPSSAPLLLETSAGTRNSMGSTFADLGAILRRLEAGQRAAVCLDTAHVWAAGYDVATPDGLERTLEEFDREIGLEKLALIHANDSKVPLGGARDRHDNIGEGHIGVDGWRTLLQHPTLRKRPWVMETPGQNRQGPDAAQVELMRRLWHGEPVELAS